MRSRRSFRGTCSPAISASIRYIDDRASPEQEAALLAAFRGEKGGPLAELAQLIGEEVDARRAPIDFTVSEGKGKLAIGDAVYADMEPYRGPTGEPTKLVESIFSTIPGSPAYVAKAEPLQGWCSRRSGRSRACRPQRDPRRVPHPGLRHARRPTTEASSARCWCCWPTGRLDHAVAVGGFALRPLSRPRVRPRAAPAARCAVRCRPARCCCRPRSTSAAGC